MLQIHTTQGLDQIEVGLRMAAERHGGRILAVSHVGQLLQSGLDLKGVDAIAFTLCFPSLYTPLLLADIRFAAFLPSRIAVCAAGHRSLPRSHSSQRILPPAPPARSRAVGCIAGRRSTPRDGGSRAWAGATAAGRSSFDRRAGQHAGHCPAADRLPGDESGGVGRDRRARVTGRVVVGRSTVLVKAGRKCVANPGQPPYFRRTLPELG